MRTLNTFALEIQRCQEDREPSRVSLVLSAAAAPSTPRPVATRPISGLRSTPTRVM